MIKFVGTTQKDKDSLLYYYQTKDGFSFFKVVNSPDGLEFIEKSKYVIVMDNKSHEEKNYDWQSFRIAKQGEHYLLTYKLNSKKTPQLRGAVSGDLIHWKKTGTIDEVNETGTVVPDYKHKGHYVMYYGEKEIKLAYSPDLRTWKADDKAVLEPRKKHFDSEGLEVGTVFDQDEHILLTYYVKKLVNSTVRYCVGAALFDKKNPDTLIWRSEEPIWETPEQFYHEKMAPLGSVILKNELILYWRIGDANIFAVTCQIPNKYTGLKNKSFTTSLKKSQHNPIISPNPHNVWESRATFNSAAVYEDGKVHFLYRALGEKDLSVLGYATSSDGITIDERSKEPIYIPREPFETPGQQAFKTFADHFVSGGGYGGVEDPRITRVGDKFYLTYVAFDGANPPRSAMSSISVKDFLNRRWDKWSKAKLISAPGMVNKSAVIFPEKVNGKYVALHRVYPNILVDYLDDLNFDTYLQGHHFIPPRKTHWDSKKIGAGAPPMRTKDGWLLIYQSVGYQDSSRYKIGAMMLDADNPSKVLYRTNQPLIEPVESYENDGFKAGVVYPCGAVIMNDKLHVYYGGADTVVCAASADLDTFLHEMKSNQEPKVTRVKSSMFNFN